LKEKSMANHDSCKAARNAIRGALVAAIAGLLAAVSPIASGAERAYRLAPFSALELDLAARYVVRNGSAPSALIRGRADVIERIVVEQHDDRVRIFVPGVLSDAGQIVIEVTTVGLKELEVKGAGDVEGHGFNGPQFDLKLPGAADVKLAALDVDKLRVEMDGSGKIEASGRASRERIRIGGAGEFRAADLAADEVDVRLEGVGNVEVMAREALEVRLSGAGTVRYRGDPKVKSHIDGAGTVERM
jgi:Putative auto-transporter adhesin, head GIN domain